MKNVYDRSLRLVGWRNSMCLHTDQIFENWEKKRQRRKLEEGQTNNEDFP